jgi:hypothetical protein
MRLLLFVGLLVHLFGLFLPIAYSRSNNDFTNKVLAEMGEVCVAGA